jgi:hypothetical protein
MKFENFVGASQALPSLAINAERTVNLYPETVGGAGKSKLALRTTPGLATWSTLPTTPLRALCSDVGPDDARGGAGRSLFAIAGSKLYQIHGDGTYTEIGDVGDDAAHTPAFIIPNGTQFLIVSAGEAYVYDGVALAAAPVPADDTIDSGLAGGQVGTAESAAFVDGYFVATKLNSNRFFYSALNDGTTWDELDFATCESSPDRILRVLADHGELYFFGDRTTEVWRNEGDVDNVFRRDPNGTIPVGTGASWVAVNLGDGPGWLGASAQGNIVAYRGRGFTPVRVSTYAVEQAWASYSSVADARGFVYNEDGHDFWVIQFPTGNATWVYDLKENLWHERAYWNGTTLERHRANCHAYQWTLTPTESAKHLIGDRTTGVIYRSSTALLSDAGTSIRRIRTAPHLHDDVTQLFYHRFQLDIGDPTGAHTAVTLSWSDDAGDTWSTPIVPSSMSAIEGKLVRVTWRRLGDSRDRIFRVTFSQASVLSIVDAYLHLTKGIS